MEEVGAGPHKSEWTSSKGEDALKEDFGNGNLCILPYKQCVQSVFIRVHLFKLDLTLGNKQ